MCCANIYERVRRAYAPVAQLDRVTGYEPVGRGFESLPAYQISTMVLIRNHRAFSFAKKYVVQVWYKIFRLFLFKIVSLSGDEFHLK